MEITKGGKTLTDDEARRAIVTFGYRSNIDLVTKWQVFTDLAYVYTRKFSENGAIGHFSDRELKDQEIQIANFKDGMVQPFCLVMHLSNFEEISTLVCQYESVEQERGHSLSRFKVGWQARLKTPIGNTPYWETLINAEKIRNCILHGYRRVSLMKNEAEIIRIVQKEGLEIKMDRVTISVEYLNKVKSAIVGMLEGEPGMF